MVLSATVPSLGEGGSKHPPPCLQPLASSPRPAPSAASQPPSGPRTGTARCGSPAAGSTGGGAVTAAGSIHCHVVPGLLPVLVSASGSGGGFAASGSAHGSTAVPRGSPGLFHGGGDGGWGCLGKG
ncbi:hypothetical protein RHGRI_018049 [Rhododendron griersonianum]|uniref:Uncharacterized protein n=1 Tax=Rhododendron griersonianum TaxID=479676 RepID=A0AAV6K011_9ERIC|nr:hypothetical protein RHGRI_018049 [Rhododendron griersonianum]